MFSLNNSEYLILLIPLFLLILFSYYRARRKVLSLILRALVFILAVLALSDPYVSYNRQLDRNEAVVIYDNSASFNPNALKDCETQVSKEIKGKKIRVNYFSNKLEDKPSSKFSQLTNYENVFRDLISQYGGSDIVICTDGRETSGNFNLVKNQLASAFKSVSIIYPSPETLRGSSLEISNMELPLQAKKSDPVQLSFTTKNNSSNSYKGEIIVRIDDKPFKNIQALIDAKTEKKFQLALGDLEKGNHKISVLSEDKLVEASKWINITDSPKLILISQADNASILYEKILKSLQIDYQRIDPSSAKEQLINLKADTCSGLILNNVKASDLGSEYLKSIESFVADGGGLLISGGDTSYGLGGYQNTILDKISPLKSVPPRSKIARAPSAVILLLDKSGSMGEQGKLHAAKLAAISSIYSLKPDDFVGVIGFDYAPLSVVDLDLVEKAKLNAKERLANLTAYGQTNLLPGLALARLRLSKVTAGKKHIIVLSDGQIPTSSDVLVGELNRVRAEGITISTVALGYEADGPFMKMLAQSGKGSFYQTVDSSTLPKLFVDDIKMAVGEDTMKEDSSFPVQISSSDISIRELERFPQVLGFVETEAKADAQVELTTTKANQSFPLYANWKYLKGNVSALATDLQGRWTGPWLHWPKFINFCSVALRKISKKDTISSTDLYEIRYEIESGRVKLESFIYDKHVVDKIGPKIFGSIKLSSNVLKFELVEKSKGRYEGYINLSEAGDFETILKLDQDVSFKIAISAKDLGETSSAGIDYTFLEELKDSTNGSLGRILFGVNESKILSKVSRSKPIVIPLLISALFLLVVEVIIRERKK